MLPAQGCDFGCQIDTYRAPGDTPATTNTTQSIELDLPAGHFMRQPLAIPSADIWTGIPTIYIAVIGIEARIPDTFSPARLAGSQANSDNARRPASEPTFTRNTSSSSVRLRSNPSRACGPVPSEAQKQVPPGCRQLTLTMKAL